MLFNKYVITSIGPLLFKMTISDPMIEIWDKIHRSLKYLQSVKATMRRKVCHQKDISSGTASKIRFGADMLSRNTKT